MKIIAFVFLLVFTLASTGYAQKHTEFNRKNYLKTIQDERLEKDKEMLNDEHSAIPEDEKSKFVGLNYYRVKLKYRKKAVLERFAVKEHFYMKTTTSRLPEYAVYGKVTFRHNGKKISLFVYQNIELVKKPGFENYLFLPFNDFTNNFETYGGGRFLDLQETGTNQIIVDFNKAYNPYCAYNHKYSCPIPPVENKLNLKIKAGEKKWHD
jgi:hypothetical protein